MTKGRIGALTLAAFLATSAWADEGSVPEGIPRLDHVFVIMMENHGYSQNVNNPNAPFINQYVKSVNLATHYFAIGHPSLTNYLEIVGGSNFGVLTDSDPPGTTHTAPRISAWASWQPKHRQPLRYAPSPGPARRQRPSASISPTNPRVLRALSTLMACDPSPPRPI